jgi:hypothetical protein
MSEQYVQVPVSLIEEAPHGSALAAEWRER